MKKIIAIAVATLLSASASALPKQMSQTQIQKNLMQAAPVDLVAACVVLKSNHKICGYFSRKTLMKANSQSKGDVYFSIAYLRKTAGNKVGGLFDY